MSFDRAGRLVLALLLALNLLVPVSSGTALAGGDERTLYLSSTHRDDTIRVTFYRNGQYDKEGLKQLNWFLRDWRTNEPTQMDPALFTLVWQVYQAVGAKQPVHIVSSYRSPKTNAMLRSKSSGVAEDSQHTHGRAMDFFIPGIDLATLRATAMRFQVGGVGYYPTSGSPFVHLDTGSVRAWPRMTKAQLKKIFPDGKTLHLPTDGVPLSSDGRAYAQAQWEKCKMVPCGAIGGGGGGGPRTLVDMIFGSDDEVVVADAGSAPVPVQEPVLETVAPIPLTRPVDLGGAAIAAAPDADPGVTVSPELAVANAGAIQPRELPFSTVGSAPLDEVILDPAPMPALKSVELAMLTGSGQPQDVPETAVAALMDVVPPAPAARILMTPKPGSAVEEQLVTAYVPEITPDAEAQRALELLIERGDAELQVAAVPEPAPLPSPDLRVASLGKVAGLKGFNNLFDSAFRTPTVGAVADQSAADALTDLIGSQLPPKSAGPGELVAPDFDHVAEIFMQPTSVQSAPFAVMWETDVADVSSATALAPALGLVGLAQGELTGLPPGQFIARPPGLLAAR